MFSKTNNKNIFDNLKEESIHKEEDFPELSVSKLTKKERRERNKNIKGIQIKFRFRNDSRTRAFETLSDPIKLAEKLARTRFCFSVIENKECPHGEKCQFAHSQEELSPRECLFEDNCRNVVWFEKGQYYKNKGGIAKRCDNLHPGETKEGLCIRLGFSETIPPPPPVSSASQDYQRLLSNREPPVESPTFSNSSTYTMTASTTSLTSPLFSPTKTPRFVFSANSRSNDIVEIIDKNEDKNEDKKEDKKEDIDNMISSVIEEEEIILKSNDEEFALEALRIILSTGRSNIKIILE